MKRPLRALTALWFVLIGSFLMQQVRAGVPAPPPVVACEPAFTIDGHLQCGEAGMNALHRACGPAWAVVRGGDAVQTAAGCRHVGRMDGADLEALAVPVDVNSAALPELESLPGIGPVLARRITEARPFARVDDLRRVPGLGPVRLARLRQRARVLIPRPRGP